MLLTVLLPSIIPVKPHLTQVAILLTACLLQVACGPASRGHPDKMAA
jgi:hypothetical protein